MSLVNPLYIESAIFEPSKMKWIFVKMTIFEEIYGINLEI